MQKRWLVKRRQLVVLEATTYTRIYGQQQLGKCWCVARSQPTRKNFRCKVYSCKIFSYVFCVRKYFCNEQKANYGTNFSIISGLRQDLHTHVHLLHASSNLPGMELVWNCGIPPKTPILFYSIPGRNTLTCIQYKFTPQSAKFQNHSNSDISIPKPWF